MTLFMINLPAALYAFRLIKPEPMRHFRADVLDYVISGGVIGAVGLTLNYAVIYFASLLNTGAARSSSYGFLMLWGMLALWNTQGIDVMRPATISAALEGIYDGFGRGGQLGGGVFVPRLPLFTPLEPSYWAVVIPIFALSAVLTSVLTRTRGFVNLLWQLSEA